MEVPRLTDPPAAQRRSSRLGPVGDRAPCTPDARLQAGVQVPRAGVRRVPAQQQALERSRGPAYISQGLSPVGGRSPVLRCGKANWLLPGQVAASSVPLLPPPVSPPAWHTRVPGSPRRPAGRFLLRELPQYARDSALASSAAPNLRHTAPRPEPSRVRQRPEQSWTGKYPEIQYGNTSHPELELQPDSTLNRTWIN